MTALSLLEWRPPARCGAGHILNECDCRKNYFDLLDRVYRADARFGAGLDANPRVYGEVVRLAREWRAIHGPTSRVGIATLWEHLRWSSGIATTGDDFKLNNTWRAPMARLVMAREPDLAGVFETRGRQ